MDHTPENTHINKVSKRPPVKVKLTVGIVNHLDFHHWPVSPAQVVNGKLITEPTPPHVKDWTIRDLGIPGFGIRVTARAQSYFVQRKRKGSTSDRWVLADQSNLDAARNQAIKWYAEMADGGNPTARIKQEAREEASHRKARRYNFGEAFADYVDDGEARVKALTLRPASLKDRKAVVRWMEDSKLWKASLADLDVPFVKGTFEPLFAAAERARRARRVNAADAPKRRSGLATDLAAVHKVLTYCKACWNFSTGIKAEVNPFAAWAKGTTLPKVPRRQKVLPIGSDSGVKWLKGLEALRHSEKPISALLADYLMLGVMLGGRRSELAEIRWTDVSFRDLSLCFAAETTKANRDHFVPLTPWGVELLKTRMAKNKAAGWSTGRADRVFPYPTTKTGRIEDYRPIMKILKKESDEWIGLHDLRRTLATSVFGSVMNLGTVAVALGHSSGQDVTVGYLETLASLAPLRDLYAAREKRLRLLIGLDAPPPKDFSDTQTVFINMLRAQIKQLKLDHLSAAQLGELLLQADSTDT